MENHNKKLPGLLLVSLFIFSCQKIDLEKDVPACIEHKIRKIQRTDVQNPPAVVVEWKVDGRTYYYISSDCCDQFSFLYDDNCKIVCAPDGGLTGAGDGNCPDLRGKINTIVWKDDRK